MKFKLLISMGAICFWQPAAVHTIPEQVSAIVFKQRMYRVQLDL